MGGWMDRWVDGSMDGWVVELDEGLPTAHSCHTKMAVPATAIIFRLCHQAFRITRSEDDCKKKDERKL